eukprot:gene10426-14003_t
MREIAVIRCALLHREVGGNPVVGRIWETQAPGRFEGCVDLRGVGLRADSGGAAVEERATSVDVRRHHLRLIWISRARARSPITAGFAAVLTVGRGQRLGLFAGSGVGKSVLLGMMARYTQADVIVVGLIGERGREVKEFVEDILGQEGRARSVVVAAPADAPPLLRMQGAAYATAVAEHFRDKGQHVLLLMDSLTRYAMAQLDEHAITTAKPQPDQRVRKLRNGAGVPRVAVADIPGDVVALGQFPPEGSVDLF